MSQARLWAMGVLLAGASACAPTAPDVTTVVVRTEVPGGQVLRGAELAQTRCAACHAVSGAGDSPMAEAPPLRSLHERYPVVYLQEALAEGLTTAHPAMPQVELAPDEITALIAYLESLETD